MRLARAYGVGLRQSYVRLGKRALITQVRYRRGRQHKRDNKAMRKHRTYLGRTVRGIWHKSTRVYATPCAAPVRANRF